MSPCKTLSFMVLAVLLLAAHATAAAALPLQTDSLNASAQLMDGSEATHGSIAVKTNGLYDLALAPNIDIEYTPTRNWSLGADGWLAWLRHHESNLWWQNYGFDIYLRRWFGRGHDARNFRGWHAGIYAGTFTYDIWSGGKGYQSPDMFRTFRVGGEIGWSASIGKRWRVDIFGGTGLLHTRQIVYHENNHGWYSVSRRRNKNLPDLTRFGVTIGYRLGKLHNK